MARSAENLILSLDSCMSAISGILVELYEHYQSQMVTDPDYMRFLRKVRKMSSMYKHAPK